MFYAIKDFGLELARLERGSSRRTTVMRYPTREYQSDSSSYGERGTAQPLSRTRIELRVRVGAHDNVMGRHDERHPVRLGNTRQKAGHRRPLPSGSARTPVGS